MQNLMHFRSQNSFESILRLLENALPDNQEVQNELEGLINKKSSFIRKLQRRWIVRLIPLYTEKSIREMNLEFLGAQVENRGDHTTRGFIFHSNQDTKFWVLKQTSTWLSWDPSKGKYFKDPILFGGDLNFKRNFEPLVISET